MQTIIQLGYVIERIGYGIILGNSYKGIHIYGFFSAIQVNCDMRYPGKGYQIYLTDIQTYSEEIDGNLYFFYDDDEEQIIKGLDCVPMTE